MNIIYYIINYLIIGWFLFVISYYRDLYNTKETYSRPEVFSYPQIIKEQFRSLFSGIPFSMGMLFFILSSSLGAWMPLWGNIFGSKNDNWFFNSSAPFLILYFIIPSIFGFEINQQNSKPKKESSNASESNPYDDYPEEKGGMDSLRNLFQDHYNLLAAGFGLGYVSHLTFNWGVYLAHPFFWNIANGAIIFWFSLQSMRNEEHFKDSSVPIFSKSEPEIIEPSENEEEPQEKKKKRKWLS